MKKENTGQTKSQIHFLEIKILLAIKIKISVHGLNTRQDTAEQKISDLGDRAEEIAGNAGQKSEELGSLKDRVTDKAEFHEMAQIISNSCSG